MQGELTDNPPARNFAEDHLTDDESGEELDRTESIVHVPPPVVNRILASSSSSITRSNIQFEPNATSSRRRPSSESLFSSKSQGKSRAAELVGGASSDEELSSRLGDMSVKDKREDPPKGLLRKTVTGRFSDLSEEDENEEPPEVVVVQEAAPVNQLADTVIQSSSDEEDPAPSAYKQPAAPPIAITKPARKPSLPDTIIGFSESMSGFSIQEPPPMDEIEEVEELGSEEESEFDEDVITVLDSDEEIIDADQPPILQTGESFLNCSSVDDSRTKTTDSDTTVNKFFNNPPLITTPERFITHSVIRRHNEGPDVLPDVEPTKATTRESLDRFKLHRDNGCDPADSFEAEDFELAETDISESENKESPSKSVTNQESRLSRSERTEVTPPISSKEPIPTEPTVSSLTQSSSNQTIIEKINISTNININLKISMRHSSDSSYSSESSSSSSSGDSQPPLRKETRQRPPANPKQDGKTPRKETPRKTPRKETPRKETPKTGPSSKKAALTRKEKHSAASNGRKSNLKDVTNPAELSSVTNESDFITPTKTNDFAMIDDDLQEALTSVYGDSWKTPQFLRSCKPKTVRQDLRKSIHANNFDACELSLKKLDNLMNNFCVILVVTNLSSNLESTRITPSTSNGSGKKYEPLDVRRSWKKKQITATTPTVLQPREQGSSKKKPASSAKKTVRRVSTSDESDLEIPPVVKGKRNDAAKIPNYKEICDSDTPEDDSSDSDIDGNETWNASSDEEYENEQERIKKRSVARKSRKDEEIIFIPEDTFDDRQKKIDELDRFEFKKPPGILTPRVIKKKLFTHSHYDDDTPPVEDTPKPEKENDEPTVNLREIFFRSPFPVPRKAPEVKERPSPSPKTPRKTPKSSSKATAKVPKSSEVYSFLKSLDVDADPILCHPDAYSFRKNYKTKKEELTDILFKLYNEKVFDNQLADVPTKWNKKLLNTAGRCNNSRRNGVRGSQLELSDKVLTSADRLRCTLIHEMCHAATWVSFYL